MPELDYVVVLAGGLSSERDISLRSGSQLRDALSEAGVQVVVADADAGLLGRLRADPPSAVFPVIHGAPGEDGSIPEVLELLGVPYVGSLPAACRMAFDKPAAKTVIPCRCHCPGRPSTIWARRPSSIWLSAHLASRCS
jgi:D-alanine-D-alanine ligase